MLVTWQEQLERHPALVDIQSWPNIALDALSKSKKKGYTLNYRIVSDVLGGMKIREVAQKFGLTSSRIYQLMNRCLSSDGDDAPALSKALIPHYRLQSNKRIKVLNSLCQPSGCANSFRWLLDNIEGLREHLDELLNADLKDLAHGQNLTIIYFHKSFKRYLRSQHWPEDHYPFTEDKQAYETLRKYYHSRKEELSTYPESKREIIPKASPNKLLQVIEIDEQLTDSNSSVWLNMNGILHPLRLARCTLVLMIDVAPDYVLHHQLFLNKTIDKNDFLTFLHALNQSMPQRQLTTPGLNIQSEFQLSEDECEQLLQIQIGEVSLDNAMVHWANSTLDYITEEVGARVHFDRPKLPKSRNFIEYAFNILNKSGIHRNKGTTGSSIVDPNRESRENLKTPPKITITALQDMIAVLIAEHNNKAQARLGAISPIEFVRHSLNHMYQPLRPKLPEPLTNNEWYRAQAKLYVPANEQRRPYVNFCHVRYTLSKSLVTTLTQQKVELRYNNDIRKITAYSVQGEKLGTLIAPRTWQRFPHSKKTRKTIFKLVRSKVLKGADPLAEYFELLYKNRHSPSQALELTRVYEEYSVEARTYESTEEVTTSLIPNPRKKYQWSTHYASQ